MKLIVIASSLFWLAQLSFAQDSETLSRSDWTALIREAEAAAAEQRFADGIASATDALERARDVQGESHPDVLYATNLLASLYAMSGQYGDAEPLFLDVLDQVEAVSDGSSPDLLIAQFNLADLYLRQRQLGLAEERYQAAYTIGASLGVGFQRQSLEALAGLAQVDMALGRWDAAQQRYADLLLQSIEVTNLGQLPIIRWRRARAEALSKSGSHEAAQALYSEALSQAAQDNGESHPLTLQIQLEQAQAWERANRLDEAQSIYQRILAQLQETGSTQGPIGLRVYEALGDIAAHENRTGEAEQYYDSWLAAATADPRSRESEFRRASLSLARLYAASERLAAATELYRSILSADQTGAVAGQSIRSAARLELADLLFASKAFDEAEPLYRSVLERSERLFGRSDPTYRHALRNLAFVVQANGKFGEATELHELVIVAASGHNQTCLKDCVLQLLAYGAALGQRSENTSAAVSLIIDALLMLQGEQRLLGVDQVKFDIVFPNGLPSAVDMLQSMLLSGGQHFQAIRLSPLKVTTTEATELAELLADFPLSGDPATSDLWTSQTVSAQNLTRLHSEIEDYLMRLQTEDVDLTVAEFERFKDLKAGYGRALSNESEAFRSRIGSFLIPSVLEDEARDALMSSVSGDTAFVSINTLPNQLLIGFVSPENAIVRSVPREATLERDILNSRLAIFYEGNGFGDFNTIGRLQTLYQTLLEPISLELSESEGQTLIIDVDGPLRYVPFAALHNGQTYLINTHQTLMSAFPNVDEFMTLSAGLSVTRMSENDRAAFRAAFTTAGFAEPSFVGAAYDQNALSSVIAERPGVLQIESPIVLDSRSPSASAVLLNAGQIPLSSVLRPLQNSANSINLIAFVATKTLNQIEQGQSGGDEQLGSGSEVGVLQRFVAASDIGGAMMSLWELDADLGGGSLLSAFYRGWARDGLSPAHALQQAQLAMLSEPMRSHPYHWAGFTLIAAETR